MRRSLPLLLIAAIVVFYGGVAGVGIAPYYDAITSFVHGATGNPNGSGQPAAALTPQLGQGGRHDPVVTPAPTPTPRIVLVTPGPSHAQLTSQRLAAEVQHAAASKRVPKGRVNILILGSDNDKKAATAPNPDTQVMIVLSIDSDHHTATMLSIPRDFWVQIPGYKYNYGPYGTNGPVGWSKIDVSAELGLPAAACTVERNFGIPINHWIWVGLQGFTKVIDSMDGMNVNVTYPVLDDTYPDDLNGTNDPYGYRRIYLPPGPQHLDGANALHFVRSRHGDVQGDFARSSRQQILLTQLRHMLLDQNGASLVALAPSILRDLQSEVRTDLGNNLDFNTAVTYYKLLRSASSSNIQQVILKPPTYSTEGVSVTDYDPQHGTPGQTEDAVAPNWPAIDAEIVQLFGAQDTSADPQGYCAQVPGAAQ